jgi:hypothetical protein
LTEDLRRDGVAVVRLVRRPAARSDEVSWDPARRWVDVDALARHDVAAVVHLAGAGVGDKRWTPEYKEQIRSSRVDGTVAMASAAAELPTEPVFISGSAIGYYGDTGDRIVDETAPPGDTFLAGVVQEWEEATQPARSAGLRVACIRTGLVVSSDGGAFGKMMPIFRAGLGGRIGSGRQLWSFISMEDEIAAIRFLIDQPIEGPVNIVAPTPVTNADATRALAAHLHRPALLPVPRAALRVALGEFAGEVVMSQGVRPGVLERAGFTWQHPTIEESLAAMDR